LDALGDELALVDPCDVTPDACDVAPDALPAP
jgi:hypothetical protein